MNWWNIDESLGWLDSNLSWLASATLWWIAGPALIVAALWAALKFSQRPGALHRQLAAATA